MKVIPFTAPWTAFTGKYRLHKWPWRELLRLRNNLAVQRFDFGVSGRWDSRDHFLLFAVQAKQRIGFPRIGSGIFLAQRLVKPSRESHHYENWRVAGRALGIELPSKDEIPLPPQKRDGVILIHTGAGKKSKLWPLEKYQKLTADLHARHWRARCQASGVRCLTSPVLVRPSLGSTASR